LAGQVARMRVISDKYIYIYSIRVKILARNAWKEGKFGKSSHICEDNIKNGS
jgi:hypothetical protein